MRKLLFTLLLVSLCPAQYNGVKPILGEQIDHSHPLARGLIGCWLMNEGAGNALHDLSNSNDISCTLSGTAPAWVGGKFGPAVHFPGTNEIATGPNMPWLLQLEGGTGPQNMTLSAWIMVKGDSAGSYQGIIDMTGSSTNDGCIVTYLKATDNIGFYVNDSSGWQSMTSASISNDEWYHVVGVARNQVLYMWINGVPQAGSDTYGIMDWNDATNLVRLGTYGNVNNNYFNGYIDNAQVWIRGLESSEVASLYADPFQMIEQPTPELWVSAGGEPPAGNPQVIIMSRIPAWLGVGFFISAVCVLMGYNVNAKHRKAEQHL